MSKTAGGNAVFQGQLYHGEAKSKSWTPVCPGSVAMVIQQGGARGEEWQLVASKGRDKVWEGRIEPGFKHRVRDTFVQWQQRAGDGPPLTCGLRLKTATDAQQFSEAVSMASQPLAKPKPKAPEQSELVLRVLLPGRESTTVTLPKNATISHVLKLIASQHHLDPAHHAVALPPDSPHAHPILLKGSMSVSALSSAEVHIVRKGGGAHGAEGKSNGVSEQTLLLQVELPKAERTVIRVSPSLTFPELLHYVCEKRNLDVSYHKFDLPVTPESLAGKTLGQLKINSIRVICTATPPSSPKKKRMSRRDKNKVQSKPSEKPAEGSPKTGRRAPPPPPASQRRTQPELMRELEAGLAERKLSLRQEAQEDQVNGEGEGEVDECEVESVRREEVSEDSGPPTPTTKRQEASPTKSKDDSPLLAGRRELKPRSRPAPHPPAKMANEEPADVPGSAPLESLPGTKGPPPPVAEKPKKKKEPAVSADQDEPDMGPASTDSTSSPAPEGDPTTDQPSQQPTINREALDFVVTGAGNVLGVKGRVKMQAEQPEMGSITETLKLQAAAQGRYLSIKRKKPERHVSEGTKAGVVESLEKTQPLQLVAEEKPSAAVAPGKTQTDGEAKELAETKSRKPSSLRRRPRGPAPPPPKPYTAGTMPRVARDEAAVKLRVSETLARSMTDGSATPPKPRESSTLPRVRVTPARRAPTRPAPVPQKKPSKAEPSKAELRKAELRKTEPSTAESGQAELIEAEPRAVEEVFKPPEPKAVEESAELSEPKAVEKSTKPSVPEAEVKLPAEPVHTSTPTLTPKNPAPSSSPPTPKRNAAIAICREKKDGGKVLIVTVSPGSERKHAHPAKLVFNLPPPPPLEVDTKDEAPPLESKPSDEGIVMDTSSSPPLQSVAKRSEEYRTMSPSQESILSNEYTNMDDLCSSTEELETDFSNDANLDPISETEANLDPIPKTEAAAEVELKDRDELDSSSSSSSVEGGFHIKSSGSDSDSVCGYDIESASPLHQADLALPPPIPDSPSIPLRANINSNNSNNNNSNVAAPGIELDSMPPPPAQFVMPQEPLFDYSSGEDSDKGGGIVLVSVKRTNIDTVYPEEPPSAAADAGAFGSGDTRESHGKEQPESPDVAGLKESKSINTSLNELDTMVSSLQQLITETTGTPPPTPPPPRPPPPLPVTAIPPPPHPPTSVLEAEGSPRTRGTFPSKPHPPRSYTIPGKAKQQPDGGAVHSELASKLKERQKQMKAAAQAEPSLPPPIPPPPIETTSTDSVPLLKAPSSHSGTASPHSGAHTPLSGTASPPVMPSGDNVQAQLQFLQQQVLQQQMMQLQQQFQQLQQMTINQNVQSMMMPPVHGQPYLHPTAAIASPALLGMQPQVPVQQQPLMVAASSPQVVVPGSAHMAPATQPVHQPGLPSATQLPQTSMASHSLVHQLSDPSLLATASLHPPTDPPTDPVVLRRMPAAALRRRNSSSDVRSRVLGGMEETFDSLMEEVRVADPKEVLRKTPDEPDEASEPDSSSYTGMAAALAEALKQRRMHFTEKDKRMSLDDSRAEWESP